MCRFLSDGIHPDVAPRHLLGVPCALFLSRQLPKPDNNSPWTVSLGPAMLYNMAGLNVVRNALARYTGPATILDVYLQLDRGTFDAYYSRSAGTDDLLIQLPIRAERRAANAPVHERLTISLPAQMHNIPYPSALRPAGRMPLPQALLMEYKDDFDFLFANQIALMNEIESRVRKSPWSWLRGVWSHRPIEFKKRIALRFSQVDPTAYVHPTAVIEGAIIGPLSHIGAHCVVRFSQVGRNVKLHDGAKVEFSVVGDNTWLMHDLVLYRSVAEDRVFLIHGPYQFSYFQKESAAFASIIMDYRPDLRSYGNYTGPFLGAVLQEGAKALGGSMLAPGRIIPAQTWIGPAPDSIHRMDGENLPLEKSLSPHETKRKSYVPIAD